MQQRDIFQKEIIIIPLLQARQLYFWNTMAFKWELN